MQHYTICKKSLQLTQTTIKETATTPIQKVTKNIHSGKIVQKIHNIQCTNNYLFVKTCDSSSTLTPMVRSLNIQLYIGRSSAF